MQTRRFLLLLLSLMSSVAAQSGLAWRTDYDAARAEALREGRLTLVCFNQDGEEASDFTAANVYRSPRVSKALDGVVALIASSSRHQYRGNCPRFGGITCADHQRVEKQAWHAVFGPLDAAIVPQHVLLFPDGRIAWHGIGQPEASALVDAITSAKAAAKRDDKHRIGLGKTMMTSLARRLRHGPEDWLRARTVLAHAQPAEFPELFGLLGSDAAATRMLDDLAGFPPVVVEPLLQSLEGKVNPKLRPALANARQGVRLARANVAVVGQAAPGATLEIRDCRRSASRTPSTACDSRTPRYAT